MFLTEERRQPIAIVVDDDSHYLDLYSAILEERGYDVKKADSEESFLEKVAENNSRISLILCDTNLSPDGRKGYEICESLRGVSIIAQARVIGMSSRSDYCQEWLDRIFDFMLKDEQDKEGSLRSILR